MELKIAGVSPLLQVFDMPASITFYRDILGFEVAGDVRSCRINHHELRGEGA